MLWVYGTNMIFCHERLFANGTYSVVRYQRLLVNGTKRMICIDSYSDRVVNYKNVLVLVDGIKRVVDCKIT